MLTRWRRARLLPESWAPPSAARRPCLTELPQCLAIALSRFLALTPCRLVAIQLEDLAGMRERMNLPGTIDEQPNWRRRFPQPLEVLFQSPDLLAVTAAVARERPKA